MIKRIFDIFFSVIVLISLIPIFLLISLLIKIDSKGPVFFAWDVIGKNGSPFRGYKFRTMEKDADKKKKQLLNLNEMNGPVFKIKNDPRITKFGKFLRKYSLDELPQFWSVVKGDMSVVGPRPAGPKEWEEYEEWQKRKLSITPGITCLWQVNGRNDIVDFNEWVRLDLEYIDNSNFYLDIKIIFKTILSVIRGTGK